MKRHPFLPTYQDTHWSIANDSIETLPDLAQRVGRIAGNWSNVDVQFSLVLGSILGVENRASVAVFNTLRQHRTQREALTQAAKHALDGDDLERASVLLAMHSRLDKQRNDVVHGVWGKGDKTPDGIIWISSQDYALLLIEMYHSENDTEALRNRGARMLRDVSVVRLADLDELCREIVSLSKLAQHFHAHLRYKHVPAGADSLRQLREDPDFQKELGLVRARAGK